MDQSRFEALARVLGSERNRRQTLRAAAAVLFGAGAASIVSNEADALSCRAGNTQCTRDTQCCSGDCNDARHPDRAVRSRCTCEAGDILCNGNCVALGSIDHCAGCNDSCEYLEICVNGGCECDPVCANDAVCGDSDGCGGTCEGTCSDEDCASCLVVNGNWTCDPIANNVSCDGGACCNGECTPLGTLENCGSCFHECSEYAVCEEATCVCTPSCAGRGCGDPNTCGNGFCNGPCGDGTFCCGEFGCRNLFIDDEHCGTCGNACNTAENEICSNGECQGLA